MDLLVYNAIHLAATNHANVAASKIHPYVRHVKTDSCLILILALADLGVVQIVLSVLRILLHSPTIVSNVSEVDTEIIVSFNVHQVVQQVHVSRTAVALVLVMSYLPLVISVKLDGTGKRVATNALMAATRGCVIVQQGRVNV